MNTRQSAKFRTSQVAGSLRMEGILVSIQDEAMISNILQGKISAAEQRRRLVTEYKKQNASQ
jgi:type IV secretory pathway VirB4 component